MVTSLPLTVYSVLSTMFSVTQVAMERPSAMCGDKRGANQDKTFSRHYRAKRSCKIATENRRILGTPIVEAALKLAPLVFVRPIELRTAKWVDINFETSEWRYTISKTSTPHIVPLSRQAHSILKSLYPVTGTRTFVFPSQRRGSNPMSDNAILTALRKMGYAKNEMSGHGSEPWREQCLMKYWDIA